MAEKTLGQVACVVYAARREENTRGVWRMSRWEDLADDHRADWEAAGEAVAKAVLDRREQPQPDDGQWMRIAFMGHVELAGYVTEVTIGGQAAFHVDLPEKLWGGNPMAWREYAATALYSREPVTEESVRKRWESQRAARLAWEERERRYALEAAGQDDDDDDDDDDAEPF